MGRLRELFDAHQGRLIDRWDHYFPIYERHFAKFVWSECRILEIGVGHGGSLQLWKAYFGPKALIVGLDIDPQCADYREDQITVETGSQVDPACLELLKGYAPFDVIIDDGSHIPEHQHASYEALFPSLNWGGVYLIEDCHHGYPFMGPHSPGSISFYPWVVVAEKTERNAKRIIAGQPSRELNVHEREAYAQHLHPNL